VIVIASSYHSGMNFPDEILRDGLVVRQASNPPVRLCGSARLTL
jgi:hypothetical protein